MSDTTDGRLQRLLGGDELADLRRRLRARYERGAAADVFTLTDLAAAERAALESLLGRPARLAGSIRIRVADLDAAVARAGLAADFRAALETLDGQLYDRKADAARQESAWRAVLDAVEEPRLRALVSNVAETAVLKRLAAGDPVRAGALLDRARRALELLPARGLSLARLAAEALGDSHALDAGEPVAALVLRACRAGGADGGLDCAAAGDGVRREMETRRGQWARVGISVNELAAPVLCSSLRARDDAAAGRIATLAAERGEPVHLSLRALLTRPPVWDVADRTVHVCENASVVAAAADRLGAASAPLVCTDGMPGAAPQTLLAQLRAAGARLRYHGDFDWPGIAIGNFVMRDFGATPWRFGADDYRVARTDLALPLSGEPVSAAWDANLAAAMTERGEVVHEEIVIETLLRDLAAAPERS